MPCGGDCTGVSTAPLRGTAGTLRMPAVTEPPEQEAQTPAPEGETVGKRIRRLRHERGLSQRDIASPGVSYAYVSRIAVGVAGDAVQLFESALGELPEHDHALRVRFTNYLSCALADKGEFERARNLLGELSDRGEDALDAAGRAELHWSLARIASMQGH